MKLTTILGFAGLTQAAINDELRQCLKSDVSKYNLEQGDDIYTISRIDGNNVNFEIDDKALWGCVKDQEEWDFCILNIESESVNTSAEYMSSKKGGLEKRANDQFGIVGHANDNCGGEIYYTYDVDDSQKCHSNGNKLAKGVKMYNHTNKQAVFHLFHENGCSGKNSAYYLSGGQTKCGHQNTRSFVARF